MARQIDRYDVTAAEAFAQRRPGAACCTAQVEHRFGSNDQWFQAGQQTVTCQGVNEVGRVEVPRR